MDNTPISAAMRAISDDLQGNKRVKAKGTAQTVTRAPQRSRKYEVLHLARDGQVTEFSRHGPAIASFEDAFSALGHGAIVPTKAGPMAVEDILPGDEIRLANGQYETLLWRGAITLSPADHDANPEYGSLTRLTADALGLNRPTPDLILGPTARLLHRAPGVRTLTGQGAAFLPVRDFIDGTNIIAIRPMSQVKVYQLGFERHHSLSVNGVEIESLHPGSAFTLGLRGDMLAQYLTLFPHKADLEAFGDMKNPRLRLRDLALLDGG